MGLKCIFAILRHLRLCTGVFGLVTDGKTLLPGCEIASTVSPMHVDVARLINALRSDLLIFPLSIAVYASK